PARGWHAILRGPAPEVQIGLQKASYLYEIMPDDKNSTPRWRPQLFVRALTPAPGQEAKSAVAIPASALLVHKGYPLVYLQRSPGRYVRSDVTILDRDGDTVYVTRGVRDEDMVVTVNAHILLSEEFRSDVDND